MYTCTMTSHFYPKTTYTLREQKNPVVVGLKPVSLGLLVSTLTIVQWLAQIYVCFWFVSPQIYNIQ